MLVGNNGVLRKRPLEEPKVLCWWPLALPYQDMVLHIKVAFLFPTFICSFSFLTLFHHIFWLVLQAVFKWIEPQEHVASSSIYSFMVHVRVVDRSNFICSLMRNSRHTQNHSSASSLVSCIELYGEAIQE